jgi:hypothetical protein
MNTGEHPGVPARPPASAHLLVSSTDRYATQYDRLQLPTTSANWRLNKQGYLLNGYFTRLAVTQIQFQWNLPTIAEDVNDILTFEYDGNAFSAILSAGFYSGALLAAELQTEMNTAAGLPANTITVIYSPDNWFVMDAGAGHTLQIDSFDPTVVGALANIQNRLLVTLGFTTEWETAAQTLTGGIAPLLWTRWVDICSTTLTKFQRVKDATTLPQNITSDVIARVYAVPPNVSQNAAQPGQLFSYPWVMTIDYNTPKHIKWSPDEAISNFDIQVRDEFGTLIPWTEEFATEYQLTILASET